jgi:hypothetical protein
VNHSGKAWIRVASLVLLGAIVAFAPGNAVAGSRSSLVFVSVRVVDSCRVDAIGSPSGKGVDFNMRCSSAARPSVRMETSAATASTQTLTGLQPVTNLSLAATGSDQVLRIDF